MTPPLNAPRAAWLPALASFALAAAMAASAVAWWSHWPAGAQVTPALDAADEAPRISADGIARLLGAGAPPAGVPGPVAANAAAGFKLLGVIAPAQPQRPSAASLSGSALIAPPGQPARPYRVGEAVGPDWKLAAVQARSAVLERQDPSRSTLNLTLPALPNLTENALNPKP